MEKYLQQLVEDLREAARNVPEPDPLWTFSDADDPEELEEFADIERYLHGPQEKLSAIVGIETIQLPPAERLTDDQLARLYEELKALLLAYHFVPDFPEGLPERLCYTLLRAHWDDEHVYVGSGEIHLDYCVYAIDECVFPPEFCECRRLNEEMGDDGGMEGWEPKGDDELPF